MSLALVFTHFANHCVNCLHFWVSISCVQYQPKKGGNLNCKLGSLLLEIKSVKCQHEFLCVLHLIIYFIHSESHDDHDEECSSEDCCFHHLGVEVGGSILDDQLSASSQWSEHSPSSRGRLNMMDQYMQVANVALAKLPLFSLCLFFKLLPFHSYYSLSGVLVLYFG